MPISLACRSGPSLSLINLSQAPILQTNQVFSSRLDILSNIWSALSETSPSSLALHFSLKTQPPHFFKPQFNQPHQLFPSLSMKRTRGRGFRLRRKLVRVFKWVLRSRRRKGYRRLDPPTRTIAKIRSWGSYLKQGAKKLCCSSKPAGRLGWDPVCEEKASEVVPKGHLAVYVGRRDDDPRRILVPIIYFNHPFFGELLREAEREFGYNHPGRITIPCPISVFEKVKMRIAEGRKMSW